MHSNMYEFVKLCLDHCVVVLKACLESGVPDGVYVKPESYNVLN